MTIEPATKVETAALPPNLFKAISKMKIEKNNKITKNLSLKPNQIRKKHNYLELCIVINICLTYSHDCIVISLEKNNKKVQIFLSKKNHKLKKWNLQSIKKAQ
ncbi:hypothetical protein [endosymbiont GvMRE of Glomus versiforme]|uniref:hypothetical protein n=1 Tax=endosymbiont GvMRE of Glomus versiforme TaxID=2039283 RepID=UPI0011C36243|nr:hypothetical protein [endosymbiont GvMRE of Glomus versiforme]